MIKAVVFDMDGVLVDTEKLYRKYWKKCGMEMLGATEEQMNDVCDRVAGGTRDNNARVFKELMGEDYDYLPLRSKVLAMVDEEIDTVGIDLMPDVVETLTYLKEKGLALAVATSTGKERADDKLEKAGLTDFFQIKVYGDEIKRGKPYPDIYLKACEKLGVDPADAIGVEDSINGVIASSDAGLHTIMVVDQIKPNDVTTARVDATYYNISELKQIV